MNCSAKRNRQRGAMDFVFQSIHRSRPAGQAQFIHVSVKNFLESKNVFERVDRDALVCHLQQKLRLTNEGCQQLLHETEIPENGIWSQFTGRCCRFRYCFNELLAIGIILYNFVREFAVFHILSIGHCHRLIRRAFHRTSHYKASDSRNPGRCREGWIWTVFFRLTHSVF